MSEQAGKTPPEWMDVSRETMELLVAFVGLVLKWNPAINLISRKSVTEIWERHVYDSAQLLALIPTNAVRLVDLGSGAGFPGVILAIMAREALPKLRVTLVEADKRKAVFLSEVLCLLTLNADVVSSRIEDLPQQCADVLTARALAPLAKLCEYADRHLGPSGTALFSKGARVMEEIAEARLVWSFDVVKRRSKSESDAIILSLTNVRHV